MGTATGIVELDPKLIKVGWRARQDYGDIKELAASIKEVGQLQPVVVRQNKKGDHIIVAGLRRCRACRSLGIPVKAVVVDAQTEARALVMQLEENLKRKNFDRLEVGEGLKRYKVLYEKAHPATKHGARGRGRKKEEDDEADRFTKNAAKSLGLSERSVYDLIKVAELPEEEKKTIEEAKTPKERNVAAHQALRKVRQEKKEEKLKEKAVAKRKERAKAPAKKPPTIGLQKGQIEDVAPTLQGYKFDLVLADPPYGLSRSTVSHRKRTSINEAVAWDELDLAWVDLVAGLLDKEATIIVFCCAEHVGAYADRFKELGLDYRGHIVWHKTNPAPSHRPTYTMATEHIVWATKGKAPYFKPWKNAGSKASHNVIEGPICGGDERMDHPAQKPLWLIKRLVMRHSQRKDRVIDPFAGTGTTLVACKAMGRVALGVEVSPKFLRMAKLRLEAL